MKTLVFLSLLFFPLLNLSAQVDYKEIFKSNKLVWFGLDFSEARFIGQFEEGFGLGIKTAEQIKNEYMKSWNDVVVFEPNKYDFKKIFNKTNIYNELEIVSKRNNLINSENIMTYNSYAFDNKTVTVENIISNYNFEKKYEGVGLVFIIEYFNKINSEASVYVTFFNIENKQVLLSKQLVGEPKGFGLRNYWAGAIYDILLHIYKSEYAKWEQQ